MATVLPRKSKHRAATKAAFVNDDDDDDPLVSFPLELSKPLANPWGDENFQAAVKSWRLTDEDVVKLRDLQHRLSDIQHWKNEPCTVLRFMFAPWGYEAAETKFRNMIQWRLDNNVDTIFYDYKPPEVTLRNAYTTVLHGCDRDGDPIILERPGSADIPAVKHIPRDQMLQQLIWLRELITRGIWIDEFEQAQGRKIKYLTFIYDMQGLSSRHMEFIGVFLEFFKIGMERYPGKVKRVIIIRAPPIFKIGWNFVKKILRQELRDKIVFANKKDYVGVLDKYIDRKHLPEFIDPERGCGRSANGLPGIVGSKTWYPASKNGFLKKSDNMDPSLSSSETSCETDDGSCGSTSTGSIDNNVSVSVSVLARGYF